MKNIIIDVREREEFDADHVDGSVNIPLSSFASMAPNVLRLIGAEQKIVIMCGSGNRARQAISLASRLQLQHAVNCEVYEGGIAQWKKSGKETVSNCHCAGKALPLPRQVQLVIGSLIVAFGVLGYALDPTFSMVAAAMGFGVFVAGATGYCMLANSIAKLPWNRAPKPV